MAGLTSSGFVPETYQTITDRMQAKYDANNPGFNFDPESPDGQQLAIFAYELSQAWAQLDLVYKSYDPKQATGAALRNLGLITGVPYGTANRSYTNIEFVGTAGTVVPADSLFTDDDGNEYYLAFDTVLPSDGQVICRTPGPVPVVAGTVTNIVTPIAGLNWITHLVDGVTGSKAMTDQEYRNLRTATVMRQHTGVVDTMRARLLELGLAQADVFNNDSLITVDSVPAQTIRVTVGEVGTVTDQQIALTILNANAMGCPTYGNTAEVVVDDQGHSHTINFDKAVEVPCEIEITVQYLNPAESAGAETDIANAIADYINNLLAGEDVIWSHLFQYITPYGDAQVDVLLIGTVAAASPATGNIVIATGEYASIQVSAIDITVTP